MVVGPISKSSGGGEADCTFKVLIRFSLFSLPFRQAIYLLQKSLQSSFTFSSSNKWIRRTCNDLSI